MRIRIALGVGLAVLVSLVAASPASACLGADLTVSPSAGPGDPVSFSISGIDPGATYTISLGGQQVASGSNSSNNNGVSGTFTMPDLGSQALTVYAAASSQHAADGDSLDPSPKPIAYQPPVAALTDPQQSGQAPASSSPRNQDRGDPTHHQRGAERAEGDENSSAPGERASASAPAVLQTATAGAPSSEARSSAKAQVRIERASTSVPDRLMGALASTTSVGPAHVPTVGLLLMAGIFILGTFLAASFIYYSQRGLDPKAAIKAPAPLGPDPMEVELQEIIAAEMARKLLTDLDLGGLEEEERLSVH